jgi:hypothetical protein
MVAGVFNGGVEAVQRAGLRVEGDVRLFRRQVDRGGGDARHLL